MIKDVPKNAKINLNFYHFVQDCRKIDKIYLFTGGNVKEEEVKPDIDIFISSDYINKIKEGNLCEVLSEAWSNGDIDQEVYIGNTKLMWTYKGLLKYKSCLGL